MKSTILNYWGSKNLFALNIKSFITVCSCLLFVSLFCATGYAQTNSSAAAGKIEADKNQDVSNGTTTSNRVEVETGVSIEHLSNNFAGWREAYLSVSKKFKSRQAVYGIYRETSRQHLRDRELTAGFYQPVGKKTNIFTEISASPTHRVLPKFSTLLQIEQSLKKGWGLQGGWRHTEYNTAITNTGIFTGEKYFSTYRAAYTIYLTNLRGAGNFTAHRAQFSKYYNENSAVNLNFASGREVENVNGRVVQTGVQSIGIGGRHWVTKHMAVNYNYAFVRQGSIYNRQGVSFGLRFRL